MLPYIAAPWILWVLQMKLPVCQVKRLQSKAQEALDAVRMELQEVQEVLKNMTWVCKRGIPEPFNSYTPIRYHKVLSNGFRGLIHFNSRFSDKPTCC